MFLVRQNISDRVSFLTKHCSKKQLLLLNVPNPIIGGKLKPTYGYLAP